MELNGTYTIPARREAVRQALMDLAILRACIPGCEALEQESDDTAKAIVAVEIDTFAANFTGRASVVAGGAHSWSIESEGRGRPAGSAKGRAVIALDEKDGVTVLTISGSADVGGQLNDIDEAAIIDFGRGLADSFVERLSVAAGANAGDFADRLDHPPAGVPRLGDEPSEREVEDSFETAGETAERIEERIELAAAEGVLGGPYVWGALTIAIIAVTLVLMY